MTELILILLLISMAGAQNYERTLIEHLFQDYIPKARPLKNTSRPIVVEAGYSLVAMENLDEREQVLHTYCWLQLKWKDEYLVWDPAQWGGISTLVLPGIDVWRPDNVIKNSAGPLRGELLDEDGVFRAIVYSDGTVDMWTAGKLQTSCLVDMTYFPYDDQACVILLDSWTASVRWLRLYNISDELDMAFYRPSGQWNVLATRAEQDVIKYGDSEDTWFDVVRFYIYLRRKPMYYVYNIVLPSVLLSLLGLMIFLLPADSGEKISLGITVLLAFSVFQLIIADNMPKTSDFLPIIGIYIICTMVVTTVSLLVSVGILCIHHHNPSQKVPDSLITLATGLSRIVCMRTKLKHRRRAPKATVNLAMKHQNAAQAFENGAFDRKSQLYPEKTATSNGYSMEGVRPASAPAEIGVDLAPSAAQGAWEDLHFLREARTGDDAEEATRQQWVEVARVLDRFMLAGFLLGMMLAIAVLFGFYPTTKPDFPVPVVDDLQ